MKRVLVSEIKSRIGEKVKIAGFVNAIRDQGSIKFIILRDISGLVQIVIANEKTLKQTDTVVIESVIEVVGKVKEEKQAFSGFEVEAESIELLTKPLDKLPIPVVEKSQEETASQKRLDFRFLDLRKPKNALIFKVWTLMEQAFREYWTENNYIEIHSPKFMSTPSESGSELFEVKYFDKKAYLAQSPQFYKQMAMAAGFEKVFEVGPVFRANPSFTSRHDTEFTGYDAEISYIKSHKEVMEEEQKAIKHMLSRVNEKYGEDIEKHFGRKIVVPSLPFPEVTMAEAKKILNELNVQSEKEGDLSPEEESKLSESFKEKTKHEFLFVTEYPATVRPFYHMRLESDNKLTKSFDLLWNGIEITTGAQREHRYDALVTQAKEKGVKLDPLEFYFDFFKYGCPPHGGFGAGPSRMLMKIFNLKNVREVTFLYRGVKRLKP